MTHFPSPARRRIRLAIVVGLLALMVAACGQKANVSSVAAGESGLGDGTEGGAFGDLGAGGESGGAVGGDELGGGAAGDAGTGSSGAGASGAAAGGGGTAGSSGGAAGGAGGGGAAAGPAAAGNRTGITDKVIKIGLHAPVTGAAAVPTEAFRRGVPVYWKHIKQLFGREVQVVFEDDEFNPTTAVRVCRKMVEQDKVFMLIGAAGGDQITACAKYANSVGVPYLSAGVNQAELDKLRGYFALSQSYLQQNPMLAQLAKKTTKNNKFGIVIQDTPAFRESKASIEGLAKERGLEVVYSKFISKQPSQSEILTISRELQTSGADVVYVLFSPTPFISLAQQSNSQGYNPTYIGPGLSNGLNLVATAGCPGVAGAKFLSPFPQLDAIDRLDPAYKPAYRAETGENPDDFGIALWGLNKSVHQVLLAAGEGMSRQSVIQIMESGRAFESNVFPKLQYSAKNHFGAQSSHLLEADCAAQQFKTVATFATGF
ncbi:MAG TPA: ABC transporter substrate-binding protein [Acidimicrobiales bacterium]|nr:ABC transporter substrate-binding protein [Acidimicrobiales bacterium]